MGGIGLKMIERFEIDAKIIITVLTDGEPLTDEERCEVALISEMSINENAAIRLTEDVFPNGRVFMRAHFKEVV